MHNYSGTPNIKNATVAVYADNELDKIITLPITSKPYVKVLTLKDGEIHYINKTSVTEP